MNKSPCSMAQACIAYAMQDVGTDLELDVYKHMVPQADCCLCLHGCRLLFPCWCHAALLNDHYFTDSMQRFLDMLTERMYGDSSDTDNTNQQQQLKQALVYLAAAGSSITMEELELLLAQKKQVRQHSRLGWMGQ